MDWQFNISIGHKSIGIWQTHNLTWIHLKLANSVMQNGHLIWNGHLYRIDQIIFIDQLNNPGNMGLSRIILAQTWSWHQGGGGGGPGPGVGGPEEEGEEGSRSAMEEGGVHHLWLQGGLQYLRHPRHTHQWLHPGGPASTAPWGKVTSAKQNTKQLSPVSVGWKYFHYLYTKSFLWCGSVWVFWNGYNLCNIILWQLSQVCILMWSCSFDIFFACVT